MYILVRTSLCPDLKKQIGNLIDEEEIDTWQFIVEDGKRRLMHKPSDCQYDDVVLRFITTIVDGVSYIKILPTIRTGVENQMRAKMHKGIVLGRFAELLNTHFDVIDQYTTILE